MGADAPVVGAATTGERAMNMTNVQMDRKGDVLTITVNLSEDHGPSKSGKTLIVATSSGNVVTSAEVDGKPVTIGLNAYVRR